jgi:DNA primase
MSTLDSLMLSASQRNSLELATARYEQNVERAGSYLQGRGIGREAALAARLGFVSDPISGHERFEGWLSIPYCTPGGVVAMKFRRLGEGTPKYDGPGGQKLRLYNAGLLANTTGEVVVIVEGELDAIIGTRVVGVPTVGTWGTNWLDHHPRCFADFARVLVVADHDEPKVVKEGEKPVQVGVRQAKKIAATIPHSEVIMPPLGLDLTDWVLQAGADEVRKAMGL